LAVVPQIPEAVVFESVNQEVILLNHGHFTAAAVDTVAFQNGQNVS